MISVSTQRNARVLGHEECKVHRPDITIYEVCAQILDESFNCNHGLGSLLVVDNPHKGIFIPNSKYLVGISWNAFCLDRSTC